MRVELFTFQEIQKLDPVHYIALNYPIELVDPYISIEANFISLWDDGILLRQWHTHSTRIECFYEDNMHIEIHPQQAIKMANSYMVCQENGIDWLPTEQYITVNASA